jgi:DNA-binding NtrC family response regulator
MNEKQSPPKKSVLLIIRDEELRYQAAKRLEEIEIEFAVTADDVMSELSMRRYSLAVLDVADRKMDGSALVSLVNSIHPELPVILLIDAKDIVNWKSYVDNGTAIIQPAPAETLSTAIKVALSSEKKPESDAAALGMNRADDAPETRTPREIYSHETLRFMLAFERLHNKGMWYVNKGVEAESLQPEDVRELRLFNDQLERLYQER